MFEQLSILWQQDPLATGLSCATAGVAIAVSLTPVGAIGWLLAGTALFVGGATDFIESKLHGR
jgi:hypothetical protein